MGNMQQKLHNAIEKAKGRFLYALPPFVNEYTGKQDLVDQYNKLQNQILEAFDRMPGDVPAKKTLSGEYDTICEVRWDLIDFGGVPACAFDSVNPYKISKKQLDVKVQQLNKLWQKTQTLTNASSADVLHR